MLRRIKQRPPSTCDAPGCDAIIPRGRLMCRDHWYAVPRPLRLEISKSWKERRIRDGRRVRHPERSAELRDRLLGERLDA